MRSFARKPPIGQETSIVASKTLRGFVSHSIPSPELSTCSLPEFGKRVRHGFGETSIQWAKPSLDG
ncbi:hypothetical protein K239x_11350 [Planctomycetes bacterium K23_9]|uniref:Uncharacterized protein n=1 Tax=Stieleria marina TaxID=1930275 RepID=A0A517NPZ5_9BACT|nr:hypothetical protein K239x_11350 [Planctomycetes bacterium K23_9]